MTDDAQGGADDPLVGVAVDGRYEVVRRVARGGMATVYLARDVRLDREVALKVMHPHLAHDPQFVERFHREAVSAARVSHPGVVGVFDQGRDDAVGGGVVYLVMEHVPGRTLRDLVAAGPVTTGTALAVLQPVLEALEAAHRAGVVHRDVKPENVLLTDDGRVKVADFGLARAASAHTSTSGMLMGTVAYLPPEVTLSGRADARSDVYSAGVTLFELLTGRQPFTGEVPFHVAHQHVTQDVPVPSDVVTTVPTEVDDLVLWMTARDPEDRPADAGELVAAVRALRRELPHEVLDAAPHVVGPAAAPPTGVRATTALPARHEHALAVPVGAAEGELPDGGGAPPTTPTTALPGRAPRRAGTGTAPRPVAAAVPAPPPARRRRGRRLALVLVPLLLLGGAAGTAGWWFLAGPGAPVPVPVVADLPRAEAEAALADAGLGADVSERFDDETPEGVVVDSLPVAGDDVRPGEVVRLFVSRGSETALVPTLVGTPLDDARAAVEALGLTLAEDGSEYDEEVPEGAVLGQQPAAGEELRRGDEVTVVVSDGREPVDVPFLVGRPRSDVVGDLQQRGLEVEVTERFDDVAPEDVVVEQDPEDGTLFRGDTVQLVVSLGPETATVPDVVGRQVGDARAALEDAGFVVQEETVLGGFFGTVRDQSVEGGTEAEVGSTVTLTVV
ncbi:Stk1 family PASTA domain-containing Ser/Thr kinase [Pseudokineococcus lusitanus]|uniref:non-specific serine/threonine protein kinase n=1 Tax=Pseudokineococcus lusitanus TaxID=763993 RepID=A0A3N1HMB1_9ACTN|nr:Stk1 family PASTA domain-containing Ser/Thr kinase [Pseudokineococcus lusitanus]ROP43654.1 serine/threonine-protein kinase [Pseudokineococcus lusitanus]